MAEERVSWQRSEREANLRRADAMERIADALEKLLAAYTQTSAPSVDTVAPAESGTAEDVGFPSMPVDTEAVPAESVEVEEPKKESSHE